MNALKERYNAPAAYWGTFKAIPAEDQAKANTFAKISGISSDFARQAVKRAVYRYVLSRLGYAV